MRIELYPPLFIYESGHRQNQEDAIVQWAGRLFVLCDGMGGHEKGEVASQTVCQSLAKWFKGHVRPEEPFADDQLREAIAYAYTELDKHDDGSPKKMGTTLTLLYIHARGATAAHIGDSRIYHVRPGVGLLYQSRDHSLVFDLFQAGEITYEEMQTYPQKNIVTRAMTPGEDNRMRPDIIHITDILPGDYFYLCSDGMLEQMTNDDLLRLLSSETTDEDKRQQLIAATTDNQDNHSAWLVRVKDVVCEEADAQLINEEPTARCNALNIMPKVIAQNETDDVTVVAQPPKKRKKKQWRWTKLAIALLVLAILTVGGCFLFFQNKKKHTDNIENRLYKNDTTRHQQPVHAPRGNDSTRHIPNR